MPKKFNKKSFNAKVKEIRKYTDINIDLRKNPTPAQKGLITKYGHILFGGTKIVKGKKEQVGGLTSRPFIDYRPRSKRNRKIAEKMANVPKGIKLKKIPIPSVKGKTHKIRFSKNGMTVETDHIIKKFYPINGKEFELDPANEITMGIEYLKGANTLKLEIGGFETVQTFNPNNAVTEMLELLAHYRSKKGWKTTMEWVTGIMGYSYKNQDTFENFVKEWESVRERRLKTNKAIRRKDKPKKKRRAK